MQNQIDFDAIPSGKWPEHLFEAQRLAFDIEIANVFELKPGEDLDAYGPFDISVAAVASDRGGSAHWYLLDGEGRIGHALDRELARDILLFLREAQKRGIEVCAWNGLSFDLRWLAHVAGDLELATKIALDLVDPMFQFFCVRGFPIGLAAVAEGFGITEKKLMHGSDAPKQWALGNHQLVLDYVAGDCRLTNEVTARITSSGTFRWRTKRGEISIEPVKKLLRVRELLELPPPDQSWMKTPLPKSKFSAWLAPKR